MDRMDYFKFNALIMLQPEKASATIIEALKKNGMNKADAATSIGCVHGTILRWIKRLDLQKQVDKLTKQAQDEGWYNGRMGRPKGAKDVTPRKQRPKKVVKKKAVKKKGVKSI